MRLFRFHGHGQAPWPERFRLSRSLRRGVPSRLAAFVTATATLSGLLAATGAAQASAAGPCGSSGVLSQQGANVTCTYATPGTEDTFMVPADVSHLSVTAIGAPGGPNRGGAPGGLGAVVSNTSLPVAPGAELWVDVGAAGAAGDCFVGSPGGYPDGGGSVLCSGGGGGSSSVLTTARANATLTGNPATDSRLLVAGGGGGTGQGFFGGSAGNAAVTGAGAGGCISDGGAGGVGPTDGSNGAGGGGCAGLTSVCAGGAGTPASGGVGTTYCFFGGGGGGGWFGGGGGGGLVGGNGAGGAGGGGGSSYGGAGAAAGITIATASSSQAPEVTISYAVSIADLAAKLVADSIAKGSGTALADKASAIQAAVKAGDKTRACDDLTDYLRKVKDETGKHLSPANAALLTADATDLAQALGC